MSFGRRASEEDKVPAPKAYADTRRPCVRPRTQFGNPSTPIGSPGPFQAGGQAPPIHCVTVSQQGEFNGIPGRSLAELNSDSHKELSAGEAR